MLCIIASHFDRIGNEKELTQTHTRVKWATAVYKNLSHLFSEMFIVSVTSLFSAVIGFWLGENWCCRFFLKNFICLCHFVTMTDNKNRMKRTQTANRPNERNSFVLIFFSLFIIEEPLSTKELQSKQN